MQKMSQVETLTALVDFYNLKKEGKVTGSNSDPILTSGKDKFEGMMPILRHLNTKQSMLGETALQKALVRQWISYQVINLIYRLNLTLMK